MYIIKPSNLVFQKDIIGYNPKHHEKYVWLIHLIVLQNIISKNSYFGYINLKSELLRKYIGDKFSKKIIIQLKKSGIIDVIDNYEVGKNSKSYRLSKKYSTSGIEKVDFDSKKAKKYIEKHENEMQRRLNQSDKNAIFHELLDNVKQIEIDFFEANKNSNELFEKGEFESLHAKGCHDYYIESIANGDVFFSESNITGRVYHSICNCNRAIRKFLNYKGQKLFQVDLANSQPVLFCPMIQDFVKINWGKYCIKIDRERVNKGRRIINIYNTPYVESFYPSDVLKYIELTKEGKFYEFLMNEFKIPIEEREEFKIIFFKQIFYSKIVAQKKYKNSILFQKLFPTVYDAILWYKRNNHADLSIKLQKAESDIVINGVCKRLISEYPEGGKPFFIPIHDALISIKMDLEKIYIVMEQEMAKALGFIPTLRRKTF